MKRILYFFAIAAFIVACTKQETPIEDPAPDTTVSEDVLPEGPQAAEVSEGRVITVSPIETKTSISEKQEGGYTFSWSKGDYIYLYEFVYENLGYEDENENAKAAWQFGSDELEDDASTASFTVDLSTTLANPKGGKYRYVAVYPYSDSQYWSSDSEYSGTWPDAPESLPVHPVIVLRFSTDQRPSASSFDPGADIIVSKVTALDERAKGDISLYYSRVGAIVKMTLTGLPANCQLDNGTLELDADYSLSGYYEYDVEMEEVRPHTVSSGGEVEGGGEVGGEISGSSSNKLNIYPNEVYTDAEGKADIWLRVPAGEINEVLNVSFDVWGEEYQMEKYVKEVDLASKGKSIKLANGRMTTFTVAMEKAPELTVSYTYTDSNGEEQTSYDLSLDTWRPDEGTFTLDVDYPDLSRVTVDNSYCDWVTTSFDSSTGKLVLQYSENTTYETSYSYGIGRRSGSISVTAGDSYKNIYVYQYKRDFRNTGQTWNGYMTWTGGDDVSDLICNFTPKVTCADHDINWSLEHNKDKNGLWHTLITVTAQPLTTTYDTAVESDIIISDPTNESKYLTIKITRFAKVTPGKKWLTAWASARRYSADYYYSGWYSFAIKKLEGYTPEVYSSVMMEYDAQTSVQPRTATELTAAMLCTPDADGNVAQPVFVEQIEGSDKYSLKMNLGKGEGGDDIIRYLCAGSLSWSDFSYYGMGFVPVEDFSDACKWDIYYVGDDLYIANTAEEENHEKASLLGMGVASGWDNNTDKYFMASAKFGAFPASWVQYGSNSLYYYGYTTKSSYFTVLPTLIPYEEAEPIPVSVTGVSIETPAVSLDPGETAQIVAVVTPSNAADKSVTWSSSDNTVATVDENGLVTAKKTGEAVITATTTDGSFTATCTVTVNSIAVTGISLDKQEVTLSVGDVVSLTATVLPEDASNTNVTFQIASGSDVVELNPGGTGNTQSYTAIKAGQAYIQVRTEDGGYQASCHLTVEGNVDVTSIVLIPTSLTLDAGEEVSYYDNSIASTKPYTYNVLPGNATNRVLNVSSSNEGVVTVSVNYSFLYGYYYTITAVASGSASISFKATDGSGVSTQLPVTVNAPTAVTGVSFSMDQISIYEGGVNSLNYTVYPSGATNQNVTWSSSDESVVTVDASGQITAVSTGTATITVTSVDGNFTATCTVTVTQLVLDTTGPVDMGLNSGLLWATANVGASSPEIYGTYFEKDNVEVTPEGWQMPTKAQFDELIAACSMQVLAYNGVQGVLLTSSANGNMLFFPMAGMVYNNELGAEGYYVVLWTSTKDSNGAYVAMYDGQTFVTQAIGNTVISCPVRAVKVP